MKKIICILLTACLLSTMGFATAFAEDQAELDSTLELLNAIGISTDYTAETVQADAYVTRAAFAEYICKMINADDLKAGNTYYHDVSNEHWAFDYIGVLTEKNIISGDEKQNFRPDEYILCNEATRILMSMMGYDVYAQAYGGYPQGYLRAASEAELLKKCSGSAILKYSDMFFMIENALKGDTVTVDLSGKTYSKNKEQNLLKQYFDMYYEKGTVTGAGSVDIENGSTIADDAVIIDGREFVTELDMFDYLGCRVDFVYYDDDSGDEPEIVWSKLRAENEILEICSDFDSSFDDVNYILEYKTENSSRKKKAELSRGISVIYNGELVTSGIDELFGADRFDLKLVKQRDEKDYSLAVIWAYENYLVGNIDNGRKIIYDKQNPGRSVLLDEDKYDYCSISFNGTEAAFESIAVNNVISVYKSRSGNRIKAEVNNAVITETINSVSVDDNGLTVLISDGGEYEYYVKNAEHYVSAGDEAELYLDAKGFVAWADATKKEQFFGYIIKTGMEEDFESIWIKLLNENGKIERYTTGKKVRLDGVTFKDAETLLNMLGQNKQIAVFKVNADDKITYIDTLYKGENENAETALTAVDSFASRRYRSFGRLGETILVNNKTKIFAISDGTAGMPEEECYKLRTKSDLKNEVYYTARSVRIGTEDKSYADVVIIKDADWASIENSTAMIVVTSLKKTLDDDDEVVENITGFTKGGEVSYLTEPYYSASDDGVSVGDVIRVKLNKDSKVVGQAKIFDYKNKRANSTSDIYAGFRGVHVYAHKKIDNTLMVGYSSGADFDEIFDLTSKPIIVFDIESPRGDETRIGTMGDIITYEMAGGKCSEMIIQTNYGEPVMVIVYR